MLLVDQERAKVSDISCIIIMIWPAGGLCAHSQPCVVQNLTNHGLASYIPRDNLDLSRFPGDSIASLSHRKEGMLDLTTERASACLFRWAVTETLRLLVERGSVVGGWL